MIRQDFFILNYNEYEFGNGTFVEYYNDHTFLEYIATGTSEVIDTTSTNKISILLERRNVFDLAGAYSIETYAANGVATGDTKLYLYDDVLNALAYDDDDGDHHYSKIDYNLESGFTYFIMICGFSSSTTLGYTLCVYDNSGSRPVALSNDGDGTAPDGYENLNDTSVNAEVLVLGVPAYRNIETSDKDYFKITMP